VLSQRAGAERARGARDRTGGDFRIRQVDDAPMLALCAADARTDLARCARNKGADREIGDVPDIWQDNIWHDADVAEIVLRIVDLPFTENGAIEPAKTLFASD
jgi:hypothetical protein